MFYHENSSHYAAQEHIVYVIDPDSYLQSKNVTLEDVEKLELLPGVASYLLAPGKKMVHIKENLVVIHFLNKNDDRSFNLNGEEIKSYCPLRDQ